MSTDVKPVDPSNLEKILALNATHEIETSRLNRAALQQMLAQSFHTGVVGAGDAFLIAFDQHAAYSSPNFNWFRERYTRFVYVDRIIVATAARGRGLARRLYEDLFDVARSFGHERIVCEVNLDPPNPGSLAIHEKLGFDTDGAAKLSNGKTVRYLSKSI